MELFIISQNHSMIQIGPGSKSGALEVPDTLDTLAHFTLLDRPPRPPPNSHLLPTQSDPMLHFGTHGVQMEDHVVSCWDCSIW